MRFDPSVVEALRALHDDLCAFLVRYGEGIECAFDVDDQGVDVPPAGPATRAGDAAGGTDNGPEAPESGAGTDRTPLEAVRN